MNDIVIVKTYNMVDFQALRDEYVKLVGGRECTVREILSADKYTIYLGDEPTGLIGVGTDTPYVDGHRVLKLNTLYIKETKQSKERFKQCLDYMIHLYNRKIEYKSEPSCLEKELCKCINGIYTYDDGVKETDATRAFIIQSRNRKFGSLDEYVEGLNDYLKNVADKMTPDESLASLQRIGILDSNGNLAKPYKIEE